MEQFFAQTSAENDEPEELPGPQVAAFSSYLLDLPSDPFASMPESISDPFASIPGFYDEISPDDSPKPEPEILKQPEAPIEEESEPQSTTKQETKEPGIEFLQLEELFTDIDR